MFSSESRVKDSPSSASRRRQGVVVSYCYTIGQILVNLFYVPLLLSTIGQEEYGLYQLIGSIMAYIVSINGVLSAGVGRYYSMYKAEGDQKMMESTLAIAKRLYWFLSAFVFVVVMVAVIPVFRIAYDSAFSVEQINECSVMLVILALNTVVTFNNTINIAVLTANERFLFLKGSQLVTLIAQPVLVILLVQFFPSALLVCLIIFAMNILCSTLQRVFARNVLKVRYRFYGWDGRLIRELLGFSISIVMVMIADQIFWNSGQLILGYFSGVSAVAVFGVGAQIYKAYMSAGIAVNGVFFQRVSELYHVEHNLAAISSLFAKVGRITFLVCSIILGGFLVVGEDFMSIWAGDGFEESYWVAIVVMVPLTIDICQNLGLTIMQVMDKYSFRGMVYLCISFLYAAISVVVAPSMGPVAVAVASGACMLLGNGLIMNWFYSRKIGLDIPLFWKEIAGIAIPFCITVLISSLAYRSVPFGHGTVWLLLLGGFVYLVVYAVIVGRWGLNSYERGILGSALQKIPFISGQINKL